MVDLGFELRQFNLGDHVFKDHSTHWRDGRELQAQERRGEQC